MTPPPLWRRHLWAAVPAALVTAALLLADALFRRQTVLAFTDKELRQYLLSIPGSFAMWCGVAVVVAAPVARRWLDAARTLGVGVLVLATVYPPWAMFLAYQRLPNEAAIRFFANQWKFVLRSAGGMFSWPPFLLLVGLALAFVAFAWLSRRQRPSVPALALGVVLFAGGVGGVGASRLSPSLPLLADATGVRFLSLLARWGGDPPAFFEVVERVPPPLAVAPPPQRFDVLWIIHETMGAQYLVTPGGRPVAPKLLALRDDPAVVWLDRLHTQSSCTDVSVPSQVSGVSAAASLLVQQQARLPFDVARAAGAYTFLTAAHRMAWAHLDGYFGAPRLDRFVGAEAIDPACDDDVGVPDERAYHAALEAMDEAHRQGRRFMGVVKTNATHGPYQVDSSDLPFSDAAGFENGEAGGFVRYLNSMHFGDRQFGDFWEALKQRPFFEDTLVVITADHGEAFGQHGLWSHCGSFYPEESHVPGALRLPKGYREDAATEGGRAQLQAVRGEFLGTVDLFPTVAEVLGWSALLGSQFDGRSWLAAPPATRRYVFTNCSDARGCPIADLGVYDDGLRWVYSGATRRWQAFDEAADPRATRDVAGAHQPRLQTLLDALVASPREGGVVSRLVGR